MIIANPIYDVVFKRLMEDEKIAKFFIGTLLNETIEAVQVKPQEFTYNDKLIALAVYRVDFIATIKTGANEYKKVLIEIQKAKNQIDLMRFRNYLGEQYKKEDEIETEIGKRNVALPIITIYLLGFILPEIETSAIRVKRNYIDLITHQIIHKKSEFIEKLTHDCFVVQLPRIETKYQTRLDKLLSIFEQANFVDDKKIIKKFNHAIDEADIKNMTDILHYIGTEPAEKKQIEDEQEAWRTVYAMQNDLNELIRQQEKEIVAQGKALIEQEKEMVESNKTIDDQAKLIEELQRKLNEK